jgi:hypothetical protein
MIAITFVMQDLSHVVHGGGLQNQFSQVTPVLLSGLYILHKSRKIELMRKMSRESISRHREETFLSLNE